MTTVDEFEDIDLGETYPALRQRARATIDPHIDTARRELWRAYQRGALSESELARTLDRLVADESGD